MGVAGVDVGVEFVFAGGVCFVLEEWLTVRALQDEGADDVGPESAGGYLGVISGLFFEEVA